MEKKCSKECIDRMCEDESNGPVMHVKNCPNYASNTDLSALLRAADVAMRAAADPLRDLCEHVTDDVSLHRATPEAIEAAKAIQGAEAKASRISSTARGHVYDVVQVPLGNGRRAIFYGKERRETKAEREARRERSK